MGVERMQERYLQRAAYGDSTSWANFVDLLPDQKSFPVYYQTENGQQLHKLAEAMRRRVVAISAAGRVILEAVS